MSNGKSKIDIAVLQTRVDNMEAFIKKLEENHLPHIYNSLEDIKTTLAESRGEKRGFSISANVLYAIAMIILGIMAIVYTVKH